MPCLVGKEVIKPFGKASRASSLLEFVHSNICGSMNVKVRHRAIYSITLMDDYSQYRYMYLLYHCYYALHVLKRFTTKVEIQLEGKVKLLCSDQSCEYLSDMFKEFFKKKLYKDV